MSIIISKKLTHSIFSICRIGNYTNQSYYRNTKKESWKKLGSRYSSFKLYPFLNSIPIKEGSGTPPTIVLHLHKYIGIPDEINMKSCKSMCCL